ncbi:MAG: EamA family transporter [Nanoarchaeota archaeon]|nr:EamA family transporter [Nanoarchaeota archaeon]
MATELWAISLVLLAALGGSFGPIFLKKASSRLKFSFASLFDPYLITGLFFYGIGTVLFIPALKGGDLSLLYPLVSTTYVWVSLWSMWMLGEKMNSLKWIGVFLIMGGVSLIGLGS